MFPRNHLKTYPWQRQTYSTTKQCKISLPNYYWQHTINYFVYRPKVSTACYHRYQMENREATFTINQKLGQGYHVVFIRSIPIGSYDENQRDALLLIFI